MNRSKRPLPKKLQKKMEKEIRVAQGRYPIRETLQHSDELTTREMLKKYPRREALKKEEILKSSEKGVSIKKKIKHKNVSKRSAPELVSTGESPPAHIHPEGRRWIKTMIKQNETQRAILAHKGIRIGRKK
jgi:hypothetical protein